MSRKLTPRSSLQHFTREAKRWLKALRAGEPVARARLERALEHPPAVPTLRDVQQALAREFGLPGWSALRQALAVSSAAGNSEEALVGRFLDNACPDHHVRGASEHVRARHTAMRLLARFPDLADASFQTEIVCGDLAAVRAALAEQPERARLKAADPSAERTGSGSQGDLDRELGPKGWEPLLYLCFTRLPLTTVEENAVAIATALLETGADPNAFFEAGGSRYTPLVGVMGEGEENRPPHPRRDDLIPLLLSRGADPYDNQVIYNIHFHGRVLWWLQIIYQHAVDSGRKADWEDPEWGFLDMGGYGTGARWHLDLAIKHHDVALADWCLAHGANPNSPPARSQHLPQDSLYETAVRAGETAIAALLLRYGAVASPIVLDPVASLTTAALRRDRQAVTALLVEHPDLRTAWQPMFAAAERNRADAAAMLLDAGVALEVENGTKQRPLHAAAYANALDVARLLISRGAELDPVETSYGSTPLGHAVYARHAEMIELLAEHSRDFWELVFIGRVERVRQLLVESPERGRLGSGDQTPLMWLTSDDESRAIQTARLLLHYGADPAVRNKDGRTAADKAEAMGMYDLARVLRDAAMGASRPTQSDYDEKVDALLDAYHTGTPQAMERHWRHTWHRRAWSGMRRYVQLDLGRQEGDPDLEADITPEDARFLVAREHGYVNWQALTEFLAEGPRSGLVLPKPMALVRLDDQGETEPIGSEREWSRAVARLREQEIPGLGAQGQMTDAMLADLAGIESLTALSLEGSRGVTDQGLQHLARLPGLRRLILSGTAISDAGLAGLQALPNLEVLELGWTGVTDAGMAHLARCDALVELNLMGTATGDGAISALAGKRHFRRLHSGNGVTDAGLTLLGEIPAYRAWMDEPSAMALLSPVARPNHLTLRGSFTDRGLAALVGLDGLYALNLDDARLAITGAGLAPLAQLPHLEWLAFDATDDAMPYIAALPRLRFLMCQDTQTGDDGWVTLSRSHTLERIWGRRCHNLRSRGFRALSMMPALSGLSVSCLNVGDESLALLPSFPALRELMPMDVPDEGYRHIGQCADLDSLVLMYCRETTDRATEQLVGMPALRSYFASYTRITDRTPELLSGIPSLESVEFSSCAGLTDAGITSLARLPRLRRLKVSGTRGMTGSFVGAFGAEVSVRYSAW